MATYESLNLPSEILCKTIIIGDIADIVRLASASQALNKAQRTCVRIICSIVVPRKIPCSKNAEFSQGCTKAAAKLVSTLSSPRTPLKMRI